MNLLKPSRQRDEDYLKFIRTQPCIIGSGHQRGFVEAHHVPPRGGGKVGSKTDDYRTVPLCHDAHFDYHRWGRDKFEAFYGIDLEAEIVRLNRLYRPKPKRTRKAIMRVKLEIRNCSSCNGEHSYPIGKYQNDSFVCIKTSKRVKV